MAAASHKGEQDSKGHEEVAVALSLDNTAALQGCGSHVPHTINQMSAVVISATGSGSGAGKPVCGSLADGRHMHSRQHKLVPLRVASVFTLLVSHTSTTHLLATPVDQ